MRISDFRTVPRHLRGAPPRKGVERLMKRSIPAGALVSLLSALLWPASAIAQVPAAPTLVSPSGSGIAATPTYTWNAADTATD